MVGAHGTGATGRFGGEHKYVNKTPFYKRQALYIRQRDKRGIEERIC